MKNHWLKYSFYFVIGFITIVCTITFLFKEDIIKYKLKDVLKKEFKGIYQLQFENLETSINLLDFSLTIDKPVFKTDTLQLNIKKLPIVFFKGDKLSVKNFSILSLFRGKTLELESIVLEKPRLTMFIRAKEDKQISSFKLEKKKINKHHLSSFKIQSLLVKEASVKQLNIKNNEVVFTSSNLLLDVKDLIVDINKLNTPIKALNFSDFIIQSSDNKLNPLKGNYNYGIDSLYINYSSHEFNARNISLNVIRDIEEISEEKNDQKILPVFNIQNMYSESVNYTSYFYHDTIKVDSLEISDAKVLLYQNKTTHKDFSISKAALSESINGIGYPIRVNGLKIEDSDLQFSLKTSEEKPPVSILFDQIKIVISDFSTYKYDTLKVTTYAKFQNEGILHLNLKIPYHDTIHYKQYFEGNLQNIKMKSISKIVEGFAPIMITNGQLEKLYFKGIANKNHSNGYLSMRYNDLKLEILNKKYHKAKMLSFIGNTLVRHNNPDLHDHFHTTTFYFEKKQWQDQTALIINGILDGVIKSILIKPLQSKYKH